MRSRFNIFFAGLIVLALLSVAGTAQAARGAATKTLADVCTKIAPVSGKLLYKYSASKHLQGSDRARACSLIVSYGDKSFPTSATHVPLYSDAGKLISTFIRYSVNGDIFKARYYTHGATCAQIVSKNYKTTKSFVGYAGIPGKKCYKISNLKGRVGGV